MSIQSFLEKHSSQIEKLETERNIAYWNLATTGDDKYAQQLQEKTLELRKIYSSKQDLDYLIKLPQQSDPLVSRQVELEIKKFQGNQFSPELIEQITSLEMEIESTYTNFRSELKGKQISNNELKNILVNSLDVQERKEAWESSKLIGEKVGTKVLQLIALRNAAAVQAGFRDFYSMSLELQELDQKRLFGQLAELEKQTQPSWIKYLSQLKANLGEKFSIAPSAIKPWHLMDPFFQEAPQQNLDLDIYYKDHNVVDISRHFYEGVGLPVDDILNRSDLFEREKKNQHAFCMDIDHKNDIRILCNVRSNEYWMMVQLHELGHAVYDKYINPRLPYLLRTYAHINTTEASAQLFGRLSRAPEFIKHFCSVKDQNTMAKAEQQKAANLLVFTRWTLVMIHFEQAMYQQPGIDLNALWWQLVKKYQGIDFTRDKADWAAKLHLATAPVYYQNYILGEMTASQLTHKLVSLAGENWFLSKKSGEFLRDKVYFSGACYAWEETLRNATGEGLNPMYLANDCWK